MRQITILGLVFTVTERLLLLKTESNSVMEIVPRAKFGSVQNVNHVMAKQPMSGPINPIVSIIAKDHIFSITCINDVFHAIVQAVGDIIRIQNRAWLVVIGILS